MQILKGVPVVSTFNLIMKLIQLQQVLNIKSQNRLFVSASRNKTNLKGVFHSWKKDWTRSSRKTHIFLKLLLHDQRKQRGAVGFLFAQKVEQLQQPECTGHITFQGHSHYQTSPTPANSRSELLTLGKPLTAPPGNKLGQCMC